MTPVSRFCSIAVLLVYMAPAAAVDNWQAKLQELRAAPPASADAHLLALMDLYWSWHLDEHPEFVQPEIRRNEVHLLWRTR